MESTAGAWWGLLLVVYGCGSALFAGLVAAQQFVLDSVLETLLLQVQQQRSEGGVGPALGDLADELAELTGRLSAPVYRDATVTGALAFLCLVCGFGVLRRSRGALRCSRVVIGLKVAATLLWFHALHTSLLPNTRLTLEKLDEFFTLASSQSGQHLQNPFQGGAELVEPTAITLAIATAIPLLLALYAAFSRSTRVWCAPLPESGVATSVASS